MYFSQECPQYLKCLRQINFCCKNPRSPHSNNYSCFPPDNNNPRKPDVIESRREKKAGPTFTVHLTHTHTQNILQNKSTATQTHQHVENSPARTQVSRCHEKKTTHNLKKKHKTRNNTTTTTTDRSSTVCATADWPDHSRRTRRKHPTESALMGADGPQQHQAWGVVDMTTPDTPKANGGRDCATPP